MKRTLMGLVLVPIALGLGFIACHKSNSSSGNAGLLLAAIADQNQVGNTVGSGMNAISNANSGNTDSSGSGVAFYYPIPHRSYFENALISFQEFDPTKLISSPLEATTFTLNCPKGGTAVRAPQGADLTTAATVNVIWTYTSCAFGPGLQLNGTLENDWSGLAMASPPTQNGTVLNVASSLTISDPSIGASMTQSAVTNTLGMGVVNTNVNVAHVLTFTSATAYTINTNITRLATVFGKQIFSHTVTTPTPLSVTFSQGGGTRTINSGVQSIKHNLANFTATLTYTSVVFSYKNCLPTSGSIAIAVSGTRSGSGTVTFSGGTATYNYTATTPNGSDKNESGTITLQGCSMN
ncbi:hypothetical protein LEP1GSC050_3818 [Leptospira broomii serovar Hurstbridge str. 5399]|uniref:Lipoprotein n=1 Tax=Leptospira broomii serovar Hurstbridge str. 5399 TaxID=1049789 RepID=T0FDQ1_9LEPT|nr:hypothetical protein [Leptospira broomii]EQA45732.1 hypothetical protein LEP1GSC050_3818 [Leptospira broomii serovar Hurstbridge str. 5399]